MTTIHLDFVSQLFGTQIGNYSRFRLMGSRIKGSIGKWDQIDADWQLQNYFLKPKFNLKLIWLLISVG